jgi:hypothetical protein
MRRTRRTRPHPRADDASPLFCWRYPGTDALLSLTHKHKEGDDQELLPATNAAAAATACILATLFTGLLPWKNGGVHGYLSAQGTHHGALTSMPELIAMIRKTRASTSREPLALPHAPASPAHGPAPHTPPS